MSRHLIKKNLLAVAVATIISPYASAVGIKDTYHQDFRDSVKIDIQPEFNSKTQLAGRDLAIQFLASNKQRYGLLSNFKDLQLKEVKSSLLGEHYYFKQFLNGIPVDGAEIVVSISKQNQVMRVFNNTFPVVKEISNPSNKLLGSGQVEETVWDFLQVSGKLRAVPQTTLTYINRGVDFVLAYKVQMTVTEPFGDWLFYLDSKSGEIINAHRVDLPISKNANRMSESGKWKAFKNNLQQKSYSQVLADIAKQAKKTTYNNLNKADATGLVFDPDPVTTLNDDTLEDTSPASRFDAAYITRTLKDLTLDNGVYSFVGPWVTIADFESPNTVPSTSTDGVWDAKRGDNSFNDAMTYFHIDQNQRYMQSLGFAGATGIQAVSINVDTDGVSGEDNSHFIPGTNQLAFGHGCVDDNEDADVILHEYGHAINFSINSSFSGGDSGAMGEGFGDYWAASYSYSTANGRSVHPEWAFSWDGHNACWGGRRVDQTSFRYDPTQTYGAHETVGGVLSDELWSTPLAESLIELLDAGVPRSEVDQIVLEAQFGLGSGLTMPDMAASIVSTAANLFPGVEHAAVFDRNFKLMNILGASLGVERLEILSAGNDTIAAPGETVSFNVSLKNSGGTTLTNISANLTSPTANVTVDVADATYPDLTASQVANNQTAYQISIPANHVCGTDVDLSLATTFTDSNVENSNFDLIMPTGIGTDIRQESSPGTAIPDNNSAGITDQLTLASTVPDSSISVDMDITHTYRGDLVLTLTSPAGTSVVLQSSSSDGADDISGNYPNDISPTESLSAFDGEDHDGEWSLQVVDTAGADIGTLNRWAVISTSPASCNGVPQASVTEQAISATEGDNVILDASPSTDPDGDPLTYSWNQTSGPAVTLLNATAAVSNFDAPSVASSTNLTFEVTVSDNQGASNTATVEVTVADLNGNSAPIASVASETIEVLTGATVSLDASSSSDPDGDVLAYLWSQSSGDNVAIIDATNSVASFETVGTGIFEFEVIVTDTSGATDSQMVTVTVATPNRTPTAVAETSATSFVEGVNVTLQGGSSSDPDGDLLTYAWTQTSGPTVTLTNGNSEQASFTSPAVAANTELSFDLTVTDPSGESDTASISVTITDTPQTGGGNGGSSGGGGSFGWLSLMILGMLRIKKRSK